MIILSVVKKAIAQRFHKIHPFYDALEVFWVINRSLDWAIHSILIDIKESYVDLEVVIFAHILRSVNGFAHNL